MQERTALVVVIATLLTLGCSPSARSVPPYDLVEGVPENWTMSADDAVIAASAYCIANEIDLAAHTTPRIVCDSLDGERFWCVLYDGPSRMVGDHFMLMLNDANGAIEYVPGE